MEQDRAGIRACGRAHQQPLGTTVALQGGGAAGRHPGASCSAHPGGGPRPHAFVVWLSGALDAWVALVDGPGGHDHLQGLSWWRSDVVAALAAAQQHPEWRLVPFFDHYSRWLVARAAAPLPHVPPHDRLHMRALVYDEVMDVARWQLRAGQISSARAALGACIQNIRAHATTPKATFFRLTNAVDRDEELQHATEWVAKARSVLLAIVATQLKLERCEHALQRAHCPAIVRQQVLEQLDEIWSEPCSLAVRRVLYRKLGLQMQMQQYPRVLDQLATCVYMPQDAQLTLWYVQALVVKGYLRESLAQATQFVDSCAEGEEPVSPEWLPHVRTHATTLQQLLWALETGDTCMVNEQFDEAIAAYSDCLRAATEHKAPTTWRANVLFKRASARLAYSNSIAALRLAIQDMQQCLTWNVGHRALVEIHLQTAVLQLQRKELAQRLEESRRL